MKPIIVHSGYTTYIAGDVVDFMVDPQNMPESNKTFSITMEDFKEAVLICEIMLREEGMKIKTIKLIRLIQETNLLYAKQTVDMIQAIIRYCGGFEGFTKWITQQGYHPILE